jgi:trimethylamine:corrinoid methyltransferase-like protein
MSSKPFSNSEKSRFGTMAFSTERVVTAINLSSVAGGLHELKFRKTPFTVGDGQFSCPLTYQCNSYTAGNLS